MKNILRCITVFVLTMVCLTGSVVQAQAAQTAADFRAAWVSAAYNLDFPSKRGLTNNELKKEIDAIIDRASAIGLNALIVQVRPASDALYRSALFPWSETLTGTQGKAPADGFDPLTYWVERAHAKGLAVHAWINPFRITYASAKITDVKKLSADHPARQNPSWAVAYKDALYFDPGRPECRQLIADGVAEILKNYAVDGIHIDDYFYPGTDFPDDTSYNQYGKNTNRNDWRRENINALIQLLQKTVRDINPNAAYGVSPTAIWQNASSDPRGSNTRGYESYKSAYADTRRWVKEGWLDYICPQIYWYIGYEIADYEKVLRWWEDVCTGTNVRLYVGQAAYKEADGTANWTGEIVRQLKMVTESTVAQGSVFFRAKSLTGVVGDQIKQFYESKHTAPPLAANSLPIMPLPAASSIPAAPAVAMSQLTIAQPSANVSVTEGKGYFILGTCNPAKPLYINGQIITSCTPEGFFSYYAPLSKGENKFTFTQDGQTAVTRTITLKDAAVTHPAVLKSPVLSNAYPNTVEMASPGDTVPLKCTAPAGANVTAKINGTVVTLTQDNPSIKNNGSTIYAAAYSGSYTMPDTNPGAVTDLGQPIYTLSFNGKTNNTKAKASVKLIGTDAPFYGSITAESAWLYAKATTNGGSAWQVLTGQTDRVTAVTGNGAWVKIACGGWVEAENISVYQDTVTPTNTLSGGSYTTGLNEDIIKWKASAYPTMAADYDGKTLTLRFGLQKTAPLNNINLANTIFENISAGQTGITPFYTMTLRDSARLEGFYTDYANGEFRLHLKKRKTLSSGNMPLTGFTFVIDAGHGLNDTGALGPMGKAITEKDLNLANAIKLTGRLKQLGATVISVRDTDVFYTLNDRTEINRAFNPDMFISLHANSMAESTDSSEIRGLTVWYRNPNSLSLADTLTSGLYDINPRTTRKPYSNQSNFYVCRPSWTPSVIIETSFMCNIEDFAWLINDRNQQALAARIADAVLAYYR